MSKIPLSPFRSLPHWGRETASAVDRVLSLIVDLRCISSLSFIPLPPSNLRPFGAPPSIGRRECPREPLPLEGAAERNEAGLASFFGGEAASSLPSPLGKGDRAAVDRVLSQTAYLRRFLFHLYHLLETIFFALFHPARPLSGSLRSPPSPRGEGFVRRYSFSTYACIRFDDAGIAASSFRSLPHLGRLCRGNGILVSSSILHKNDRLLRAVVFMCITCLGKR